MGWHTIEQNTLGATTAQHISYQVYLLIHLFTVRPYEYLSLYGVDDICERMRKKAFAA